MVSTPGISGFKITNYYKYILYVSGVILILSFFVKAPEGMSNFKIRDTAFWIIVGGLIIWISDELINSIDDYYLDEYKRHKISEYDFDIIDLTLVIIYLGIQVIVWLIVLTRVIFPRL
jgi:hypothetical protein